jgi:hypothetical protein
MFNMLAGMGDIEKTGKAIVESFAKMVELLTEIRDDQKAVRELLQKKSEGNENAN